MRLRDVFQCEQRLTFSPEGETTERHLGSTGKSYGCAVTAKRIGCEVHVMKKNRLLGLIVTAVVGLCSSAWAGPHGGGGGFAGGGHFGGGGFGGAAFHAAPQRFGATHFAGRSFGGPTGAFRYYNGGSGTPAARTYQFSGRGHQSMRSYACKKATVARRQKRSASP